MADVGAKPVTARRALACGRIILGEAAFDQVVNRSLAKGDALTLAQVAGIQGAKLAPTLIPLCHPINLTRVVIRQQLLPSQQAVEIYCLAEISERTGVEMEALAGVNAALLTIWDLAKPVNAALEITGVRLLYKSGGKSGTWTHPEGLPERASELLETGQ